MEEYFTAMSFRLQSGLSTSNILRITYLQLVYQTELR